ncbi:MAG: ATP-dependent helicase HrpB [Microthrixaceae bacterium]
MPAVPPPPRAPLTDLPIEGVVDEVRRALTEGGTAVLEAEPGAGKTTVVPLRLLDEPWLGTGRIVVLEPRRLAARAAAARMAHLLGDRVGDVVGYRTRDDAKVGRDTRIEVVTEGILTRRVQADPGLEGTSLVIFDEFHERSLTADLGLALTLEARALLRPDLRVMVMSATLNVGDVAELLGGSDGAGNAADGPAPVISAPGRTHPVSVRWRPRRNRDRLEAATTSAIETALGESSGDVLVFLPGMGEIKRTAQALERSGALGAAAVDVHLLHGSLPADAQDAAVAPAPVGRRKVVLSTDLAETSLTVEGVTAVVDSGLARVPRFDAGVGMTRLATVSSSRASAEQRAGRAGRVQPGMAYRLWSKSEHNARPRHIQPEITQVELAGLALELAAWGAADPAALPLLDQPPSRTWEEARTLLGLLGAIDGDGRITATGKAMVRLPLHPRLARMVVAAADGPDGALACTVAALLEERDVFGGRPDDRPTSLAERVGLIAGRGRHHPQADGRAIATVRRRADELMRRAGLRGASTNDVHPDALDALGTLLLVGYPDRLGRSRNATTGGGRWRLRSGSGVSTTATDPLASARFVVVADTDGKRKDARIRVATPIGVDEVTEALGDQVIRRTYLRWDRRRDDLTERVERAIDSLELDFTERRPSPGPATVDALIGRVREVGPPTILGRWEQADGLRARMAFLRDRVGESWPDWSEQALTESLETWLAPVLGDATGRGDLDRVDVAGALALTLGWDAQMELARLAPKAVTVPSGRELTVDYHADPPALAVRLGEMFGSTHTPSVLDGRLPLRLELLNPAGRPVQVTSDLAGFWAGSWREVRSELRGRYPKHDWPEDPASAKPRRR